MIDLVQTGPIHTDTMYLQDPAYLNAFTMAQHYKSIEDSLGNKINLRRILSYICTLSGYNTKLHENTCI